jgi:hypothetical protein
VKKTFFISKIKIPMLKKGIIMAWLSFLFAVIISLFWHNEWVYSLPTPVPEKYTLVNPGQEISVALKLNPGNTKPLFLHFFNPDCPCSKFNVAHFISLVTEYDSKANFAIVVMSKKTYTAREIQDKFKTRIPVLFDTSIATACGVYSTPQAVIIDTSHRLYYRGNYNRSRYCTDKKSEYAKAALDALLNNNNIVFDQYALKAYGCQLPNCTK